MNQAARNVAAGTLLAVAAVVAGVMYYKAPSTAQVPATAPDYWNMTIEQARKHLESLESSTMPTETADTLTLTNVQFRGRDGKPITAEQARKNLEAMGFPQPPLATAEQSLPERVLAAIDPYDRKAMRENTAAAEAAMAAGPIQTTSMGPQWSHRMGIGFPINADLAKRRFNLAILPELREYRVSPDKWSDPVFRATVKIDANNRFPVRIWRQRAGVVEHITTVWVAAGPNPPFEQFTLKASDWQEGDTLIVVVDSLALMVVVNDQGAVVHPHLSGIELGSGDPTPIPGKVMPLPYRPAGEE